LTPKFLDKQITVSLPPAIATEPVWIGGDLARGGICGESGDGIGSSDVEAPGRMSQWLIAVVNDRP
jgi:hypothetical protein